MKDEIRRIMKLVQEGKLSPEDAAELIQAFAESGPEEEAGEAAAATEEGAAEGVKEKAATEPGATKDPFAALIDSIEKVTKDVAKTVNWQDVAKQVREGVQKGVEAVKQAAEEARKSGTFTIFGVAETKEVELPLSVPSGKVLRIEGSAGDVSVKGGASVGKLKATARFRAGTHEDAKAKADRYTPVLEESEQYVLLKQPEGHDFSVDLDIDVPTGVPLELKLLSGDVSIEGTNAPVRVHGKSGDLSLKGAEGAIEVSLSSGDVAIEHANASVLTVETKSGDLSLNDVTGAVNVRTSSGDVSVKRCRARNVSVEAASGDVSVDMLEPVNGTVNVRTVSGDVSVSLPDGSDCRVTLSTLRGSVACDLELMDDVRDSQRITGRLGNGEGAIDVSAVNGDVRLQLRDSNG